MAGQARQVGRHTQQTTCSQHAHPSNTREKSHACPAHTPCLHKRQKGRNRLGNSRPRTHTHAHVHTVRTCTIAHVRTPCTHVHDCTRAQTAVWTLLREVFSFTGSGPKSASLNHGGPRQHQTHKHQDQNRSKQRHPNPIAALRRHSLRSKAEDITPRTRSRHRPLAPRQSQEEPSLP